MRCTLGDGNGRGGGTKRGGVYLCATRGVLRSSAGYELCVVVLEQVFVEAHVLVFGEYGVVGFEAVFREHRFISRHVRSTVCEWGGGGLEFTLGPGYLRGSGFSLSIRWMGLEELTEQWILEAKQSVSLSGCHDVDIMNGDRQL